MVNDRERLNESDEIDLTELFKGIWKQKLLILLCTAIVFFGVSIYVLKAVPVYEAKFLIQPPTQNDVTNFNIGRGGGSIWPELTVKDVYDVYRKHLQSESLRLEIFQTVYLPSLTDDQRSMPKSVLFAAFNRSLVVSLTNKDDPTRFTVTATVPEPKAAAEWVSSYAMKAGAWAKDEVLSNITADAMVKANNLQREIDRERASSRKEREDQIARLKEALVVAKSVGLENPPIIAGKLATEVASGMNGPLTYMRGSKAIEAEINNLQQRQTDDPFIEKLRVKQESLLFLRTLVIDPASVAVFREDGVVAIPDAPVKQRKLLFMALGLVFGFAIGVSVAFVRFILLEKFLPQRPL